MLAPTPPTIEARNVEAHNLAELMRGDWDKRAIENAEYYVASGREDWDRREFFRSGEINVANEVMPSMVAICGGHRSPYDLHVLEIGCGIGRMTSALSRLFGHVTAVDVSPEMIARAKENLAEVANVTLLLGDGSTLDRIDDASQEFAFSFIVFQHIPSIEIISSYCREVFRVLKPGSLFRFQVQGTAYERENSADTWFGVPVLLEDAHRLAEQNGFALENFTGEGTQYFWLNFRKPYGPDRF